MIKIFLPLIVSFCFILESIFVELTPAHFFEKEIIVPHFLIIVIILTLIYVDKKTALLYGGIFGLLFDIVYTEIIGIYLLMFPLVLYIIWWIMKIFQNNFVVVPIVTLMGVALLEFGVYQINVIIGIADMSFLNFFESRLIPTLIFNFLFIIIVIYPFKRFLEYYVDNTRND